MLFEPMAAPTALALTDFAPVPRARARADGWSAAKQRGFIAALAETGSVSMAAAEVGMAAKHAYALRRHADGAGFRRAWAAAIDMAMGRIEDMAVERAIHGSEVPVLRGGRETGTRRVINDRLVMFLLRHRQGDRYGETVKRADIAPGGALYAELKRQILAEEAARQAAAEAERRAQPGYETMDQLIERLRARLNEIKAARVAEEGEEQEEEAPFPFDRAADAWDERDEDWTEEAAVVETKAAAADQGGEDPAPDGEAPAPDGEAWHDDPALVAAEEARVHAAALSSPADFFNARADVDRARRERRARGLREAAEARAAAARRGALRQAEGERAGVDRALPVWV